MAILRAFLQVLFCVACLSIIATRPGLAEPARYSRLFLEEVSTDCWSGSPARQQSSQLSQRRQIRLHLRNTSGRDLFQVCIYDLTCGGVIFSGLIPRHNRQFFYICSDSNTRGHILVLNASEDIFESRDLRDRAVIELPSKFSR